MEKKLEIHLDFLAQKLLDLGYKSGNDSVEMENRIVELIAEQYDLFSKIDSLMLEFEIAERELTELDDLESRNEV